MEDDARGNIEAERFIVEVAAEDADDDEVEDDGCSDIEWSGA
jgi:hypothetical protein